MDALWQNAGYFLRGILIGISIAAPVGPIGLLCIRRTLAEGSRIGLATGMGAAVADAAYGAIAAFGLTAISGFLVNQRLWLGWIGGLCLCAIGIRTFLTKPAERPATVKAGRTGAFLSTFALTVANPMTVLSFVGIFIGLGLGASPGIIAASATVLGVFAGSALWWLGLSWAVGKLRTRFTSEWMLWVNRLSGILIFAFGVYALLPRSAAK